MEKPQLSVVSGEQTPATALEFSETVRTVVQLARRGGLRPPVFRSPPRYESVDRTILRRRSRPPVVAIRRLGRPLPAVQADVIEAIVVSNRLSYERADRFRRAAWGALDGGNNPAGAPPSKQASDSSEHVA
ncbi:MAG: hypothetical protein ACR2OH_02650 [Microthrixaceae bacterium]